jgi:hypothetical protein
MYGCISIYLFFHVFPFNLCRHAAADLPDNLRHTLACMAYICHVDSQSCEAVRSVPDAAGYVEPFTASTHPHISLFAFSVCFHCVPELGFLSLICSQILCAIQHPPCLAVLRDPICSSYLRSIADYAFVDLKSSADGVDMHPTSGSGLQRFLLFLFADICRISSDIMWQKFIPVHSCCSYINCMSNLVNQLPTLEWVIVCSLILPAYSSCLEFR